MLAASGDQTISLWDTGVARQLGVFAGHTGSVKTVDPHPVSASVFASGARDGQLAVWDARAGRSAGASTSYGGSVWDPVLSVAVGSCVHHFRLTLCTIQTCFPTVQELYI